MTFQDQCGSRRIIILCPDFVGLEVNEKVKAICRKMDDVSVEVTVASLLKPEVGFEILLIFFSNKFLKY